MKKFFSIACVMLMALSASAAISPKKAPQQVQAEFGTPASMIAVCKNGYSTFGVGDFNLWIYDENDSVMAILDIKASSDSSIVGTYTMGDETFFASYFYTEAGGKMYTATQGGLSIICIGTQDVTTPSGTLTCPLYSVTCTNLYDATNDVMISFKGNCWCLAQTKTTQNTYYTTDKKINATELPMSEMFVIDSLDYFQAQLIDETGNKSLYLLGYNNIINYTYQQTVYQLGYINGVYAKKDIYINGTEGTVLTLDGGKTWLAPTDIYGYIFDNSTTTTPEYEYDFYVTVSGTTYHITGTSTSNPYAYDENTDFSAAFANSKVTAAQGVTNQFYLDADGDANDNTKGMSLYFYTSSTDPTITIPAGTYTITNTAATGTVAASAGFDGNEVYQSYAYKSTDGTTINNVWFIVSGTVTVSNVGGKLAATVNGVNSLGKTVTATIGSATPIKNVEGEAVKAAKKIVDGQVIINRNGVDYNVLGTSF